ncbi:phospholipase D/Transphosphatidylase [Xylanimonas cellulosilytica DSM 15894]|uniref:phospholipase D n=1 Tax=Xylanimonas cellulosilytica (strain DSM 15894 / JCM 12276 / CECT 5975 / KCTC 9989 / LMG 20990 / NBRC 107835 / XIL07) TaxID=446471 RepID=D1BVL8_XYLCX|nr:DISARM system phospholipase D-like protein DrmC [Xylanimonas cellulosilytica]ACZ31337.1 phospholipase D/Transphosphatidylase [Xylanimonas cellulosilytica DSM 15894]
MPSSGDAVVALGALLTSTEARLIADALDDGDTVTSAFDVVDGERRSQALTLVDGSGLRAAGDALVTLLRGIQGARSHTTRVDTLWTMPGPFAQAGALTSSLVTLVDGARSSVVCSTFNFQRSSGMWSALHEAANRPGVAVRVYVDAQANANGSGPAPADVAAWLTPGIVFRTRPVDGKPVRNHAKFLSIDHRFVVITSANFSWSAEHGNVELGVRIDDPTLADRIERELRAAEQRLYAAVQ